MMIQFHKEKEHHTTQPICKYGEREKRHITLHISIQSSRQEGEVYIATSAIGCKCIKEKKPKSRCFTYHDQDGWMKREMDEK